MRAIAVLLLLLLTACGASPEAISTPDYATRTPPPTADTGTRYTVIGPSPANARVEPVTIGPIRATFEPGDSVMVVATIAGQTVGGSNQWRVIELEGRRLYIHSSLLQRQSPSSADSTDEPG